MSKSKGWEIILDKGKVITSRDVEFWEDKTVEDEDEEMMSISRLNSGEREKNLGTVTGCT